MRKTISAYCPTCEKQTLHARDGLSNVLHLILTICTLGVWLIVWLFLGMKNSGSRTRCQTCGSKHAAVIAPAARRTI
ncbi:MAG: hypothetical protein M3R70_06330 [Actinomycetota bacterium]|nr:hypothetical protein [Actinomycetota bacterium]